MATEFTTEQLEKFATDTEMQHEYLMRHGNARVPCSRYGFDTASCAEVAVKAQERFVWHTGEPTTPDNLEYMMGLVVNNHDDVEELAADYLVVENTPGYVPDSEPAPFIEYEDAVAYAKELLAELEELGYEIDDSYASRNNYFAGFARNPVNTHDLGRAVEVIRNEF